LVVVGDVFFWCFFCLFFLSFCVYPPSLSQKNIYLSPPTPPPPPQHSSRHGPQHTQRTTNTAATPRYPQGRRQTPADAPTPLNRSMLTPFGGPRPKLTKHRVVTQAAASRRVNPIYIYIYIYMYIYICMYKYNDDLGGDDGDFDH